MSPYLIWAIIGLVSGIVAKLLLPGKDPGGLISTMLTGVAGSYLGGLIGEYYGFVTAQGELSVLGFVTAIAGAIVLLIMKRILRLLI